MKGGTKFWMGIVGLVVLAASAFAGKFTGELGLAVTTIVCTFIGGNAWITGRAIANGHTTNESA